MNNPLGPPPLREPHETTHYQTLPGPRVPLTTPTLPLPSIFGGDFPCLLVSPHNKSTFLIFSLNQKRPVFIKANTEKVEVGKTKWESKEKNFICLSQLYSKSNVYLYGLWDPSLDIQQQKFRRTTLLRSVVCNPYHPQLFPYLVHSTCLKTTIQNTNL